MKYFVVRTDDSFDRDELQQAIVQYIRGTEVRHVEQMTEVQDFAGARVQKECGDCGTVLIPLQVCLEDDICTDCAWKIGEDRPEWRQPSPLPGSNPELPHEPASWRQHEN